MDDVTVRVFRRPAAPVHGTLFVPAGAVPVAAVLVIGGSGGSEPSYVAGALAREGMAALSVAYFGRPGLPSQLRGIPLEYFADALQILRAAVPAPRVPAAVAGLSRGSEAAMLTAICAPDAVQGVVAAVPANVIVGSDPPGGPAWLRNGRPLPYAGHRRSGGQNPDALIPVEQVRGPVLLIAAGADQVWPSAQMARALSARLRQHGDLHGHTLLDYPRAGHSLGYLIPRLPRACSRPASPTSPPTTQHGQRMAPGRRVPPSPAAAAVSRYSPADPSHSPGGDPPVLQPSARPEPTRDAIHGQTRATAAVIGHCAT